MAATTRSTDYANPAALVTTDWLAPRLADPDIRIVDATSFLPTDPRDPLAEFESVHIPGAVFFDINAIADCTTGLPHMLPTAEIFSAKVGALGIGNGHRVIVYDRLGGAMAAARVWWTFRVFGHDNVALLDGGFAKWQAEGRPTAAGPVHPEEVPFNARLDRSLVRDFGNMLANVESRREQVVDARGAGRFTGRDAEPRPTKRRGHIPGSVNLAFGRLLDAERHMSFRPADEIGRVFTAAGVDLGAPLVATCGSGVTAAFLTFAAHLIGRSDVAVYDGSWAEWGNADGAPVEQ